MIFLIAPIPYRETFVYDIDLEEFISDLGPLQEVGYAGRTGVDDYRTEVLGLVKTQQTKMLLLFRLAQKEALSLSPQVRQHMMTGSINISDSFLQCCHSPIILLMVKRRKITN